MHLRRASRPEGPTPTTPHDTDAAVISSAPPAGRNQTCTKTRVRRGSPALPLPRQPPEDEGPDATTPARRIGFEIQKRALGYCSRRCDCLAVALTHSICIVSRLIALVLEISVIKEMAGFIT